MIIGSSLDDDANATEKRNNRRRNFMPEVRKGREMGAASVDAVDDD